MAKAPPDYQLHPTLLQAALAQCPATPPTVLSCDQLNEIAVQVNVLASQLRSSPQGFGQIILSLQESIAKQELALQQGEQNQTALAALAENKRQLATRLAVVKWLESPVSV